MHLRPSPTRTFLPVLFVAMLTGCVIKTNGLDRPADETPPGTTPTTPTTPGQPGQPGQPGGETKPGGTFEVSSFNADYYNGTTLVASEQVARPAINYIYSDFHGIPSQDFRGVWKGTLTVAQADTAIDINADFSWADGKLFIDDVAVPWTARMKKTLPPGAHAVRVELDNNWHTTGFNMSFTSNAIYSVADAKTKIASGLPANTKVVAIDAYEPQDLHNVVKVTLQEAKTPVFLVLASYSAIAWVIENPANADIRGIAYGAHAPGPTVAAAANVPTYQVEGVNYQQTQAAAVTGRAADVSKSEYGLSSVAVVVP